MVEHLRISRDNVVYGFNATQQPVATIRPGAIVTLETHDTSTGRIHNPDDLAEFLRIRDPQKVNPATGPLFIAGAQSGDAIKVTILAIELGVQGFVRVPGGYGVLQDGIDANPIVMVRVEGEDLIFNEQIRLKARPMVGVLGTAPAAGTVFTSHPGRQGSNMDFNPAAIGSTVWLPVNVEGALLSIGDVHAAMGDGEVSGTGVEIAAEVTVQVDLVPGMTITRPRIENATHWIATGQGETLELAVRDVVEEQTAFLMSQFDLSRSEAFLLVSTIGDVRIGQSANIPGCDATAYALFPKDAYRVWLRCKHRSPE